MAGPRHRHPRPQQPSQPSQHRSDIGRRVVMLRERLGLSREDVAHRAGVAPEYLTYLEEHPASPSVSSLTRVARALDTTVAELTGSDLSSGGGHANREAKLVALDAATSRARIPQYGVGRIGVENEHGPGIYPVNYSIVGDSVVLRTSPDSPVASAAGHEVAFEVDHIDEARSEAWSVLIVGRASLVTDEETRRQLDEAAHTESWAGSDRQLWVRIRAERVSGSEIQAR
ncbi:MULTISPECIES: helix-turn-helix domain-containing protein [Streptomyces]|uniref:helix-turn-helix domain-containing protein n=1 Tax=Streptomyces TaxID=1883 RepID=UPI0019052488|nr:MULTISPECIES: pyridoxamine 5'-phosphate oxidase family protein [unclassified Streptomyces]MCU4745463.1 pyridoxamine 5'-phosphate oxidase family protein [Streptomyces sp. G-5]QQN79534.1 pyridoxamine 5'-phosphate oxidase family protein [Streptomyces sp. XC 2026]